ncbi:hypothetical protein B9Z55_025359 [Caenorhabditis nigoni]|uniref:Uncharacterized protein n=1 Tax=Caenorhabditis nigoni TaxID=1611254 RepID=A0A2G5SYL1_9PELO|nr:hypothetical protein B9Z55_025359 [Caenorhabditis nigoni]
MGDYHAINAKSHCASRKRKWMGKPEYDEWSKIGVQYEPALWIRHYRELHAEKFDMSVKFLQYSMWISEEDAAEILLHHLIRTTFVEMNLIVNGAQTAEQLFANLLIATNEESEMPFKSVRELAVFCDSMPLNFRKDLKLYRNTGVQGRRLIQEFHKKLTRGEVIDCDNLDEILEDFRKTIHVDEGLRNFADQEAQLDYSSLFQISKTIPGFIYDKASGRLGLSPEADKSLILNAPIFTETFNSFNPHKHDRSRTVDACAISVCNRYPDRQQFHIAAENLCGVGAAMYWKSGDTETVEKSAKPSNRTIVMESNITSIHGYITPNNPVRQVEVFRIEPTKMCFMNNLCTRSAGKVISKKGTLVNPDFKNVNKDIENQKSQSFEKPFRSYDKLFSMKN